MTSASIAHHIASALIGIILAGLLAVVTGRLWPEMGLPAFVIFLLFWGLETINRIPLERRHPELMLSPGWKYIRLRYKPLELGEGEYEVTLTEFIKGQIAMIILAIPFALFVAGLIGIVWPTGRWPVFLIVFGAWTATMVMGILSAIKKE
jgi:hypothetical protein